MLIAGVDEAGVGPLAGPVVAAAVILDPGKKRIKGLRDSKLLQAPAREELAMQIRSRRWLGRWAKAASPKSTASTYFTRRCSQ